MAVRLDLFSATSRDAFSGADPEALVLLAESGAAIADPTWLGFLAASDADEDELTALLAACGEAGAVAGAMNQGLGLDDSAETTAAACATAVDGITSRSNLARRDWLGRGNSCRSGSIIGLADPLRPRRLTRCRFPGVADVVERCPDRRDRRRHPVAGSGHRP